MGEGPLSAEMNATPTAVEEITFLSQYWWSFLILAIVVIILISAILLWRKRRKQPTERSDENSEPAQNVQRQPKD